MTVESVRFTGEVSAPDGAALGEARFWAVAERDGAEPGWRGWVQITDLRANELVPGRYRLRSPDGWEAEFEPLVSRPSRVFEIDLLPIRGLGDAPWPADAPPSRPHAIAFSDDRPPRTAHDRSRFPDLPPLRFAPREDEPSPDLLRPGVAEHEHQPPLPGSI